MEQLINEGVWRYRLPHRFDYQSELLSGIEFKNQWITITNGGITISPEYAWDGCTPAWYIPIFGWVGVPNGSLNANGQPQAYYATLVHDALCQFRTEVPISKDRVVSLFKTMLLESGFPRWRASLYAKFVDWFGPQSWLGSKDQIATAYD